MKVQTSNGLRAACLVTVPVPRYRLVVWKTNGRHDAYPFADKPEITIEGDQQTEDELNRFLRSPN